MTGQTSGIQHFTGRARRAAGRFVLLSIAAAMLAACGEGDPGALGPTGVDGGLSPEGAKQEYVDGVGSALQQLGSTQGPQYAQAVDTGSKRNLQVAALAWRQGGEQLQSLDPPKAAAVAHAQLLQSVTALDTWNKRVVAAAPNKAQTRKIAKQAAASPASRQFEAALCGLVEAGYEVVDPGACTPLANADGPTA